MNGSSVNYIRPINFFDWCTPIFVCTFAYLHIMYKYNSNNRLWKLQVSIKMMRKNKNRVSSTFIHHLVDCSPFWTLPKPTPWGHGGRS